jgi:hypothetical protein
MKDDLSPCEINNLVEYFKLRNFVELVATKQRPDGTYNLGRDALQKKATELLKEIKHAALESMG